MPNEYAVNIQTAQVMDMLKKGERTPAQFVQKMTDLRKQGVDVDLIYSRLKDFKYQIGGIFEGKPFQGNKVFLGPIEIDDPNTIKDFIKVMPEEEGRRFLGYIKKEMWGKIGESSRNATITSGELIGSLGTGPIGSSVVMSAGEAARSKLGGEPDVLAVRKGLLAGGVNLALRGAAEAVPKVVSAMSRKSSGLPKYAYNTAKKNPDILTQPQITPAEAGDKTMEALNLYAEKAKVEYINGTEALGIDPNAQILVKDINIPGNINRKLLAQTIRRAVDANLANVSDKSIDAVVGIGKKKYITFAEAKAINTALSDITRTEIGKEMGGGAIKGIGIFKKNLLGVMETEYPGLTEINRQYGQSLGLYEDIYKSIYDAGKGAIKEPAIKSISKQLAGEAMNRTADAENLQLLQKAVPEIKFIEPLKVSVAKEAIEKTSDAPKIITRIISQSLLGGGLGAGTGYSRGERDPSSLAKWGLAGALLSNLGSSPELLSAGFKLAPITSAIYGPASATGSSLISQRIAGLLPPPPRKLE